LEEQSQCHENARLSFLPLCAAFSIDWSNEGKFECERRSLFFTGSEILVSLSLSWPRNRLFVKETAFYFSYKSRTPSIWP
jgi:hypothetical protein